MVQNVECRYAEHQLAVLADFEGALQIEIDAARPRARETVEANVGTRPATGDALPVVEGAIVQCAAAGARGYGGSHAGCLQDSRVWPTRAILSNCAEHPVRKQSFPDAGASVLGLIYDGRQYFVPLIEQSRTFRVGETELVVEIEPIGFCIFRERVRQRQAKAAMHVLPELGKPGYIGAVSRADQRLDLADSWKACSFLQSPGVEVHQRDRCRTRARDRRSASRAHNVLRGAGRLYQVEIEKAR